MNQNYNDPEPRLEPDEKKAYCEHCGVEVTDENNSGVFAPPVCVECYDYYDYERYEDEEFGGVI